MFDSPLYQSAKLYPALPFTFFLLPQVQIVSSLPIETQYPTLQALYHARTIMSLNALYRKHTFSLFLCLSFVLVFLSCSSPAESRVIGGSDMMDQDMEENLCALTFDDGPSIFTPQLLDMLKEYDVRATFFMLGQMANHYPHIVERVASEGHEIASHTHSHKNLHRLSYEQQKREIVNGYDSLSALGVIPTYVRPPYGSYDERTVEIAESLGMHVVLWSMDSKDWKRLPDDYTKLHSVRGTAYEKGEMRGVFLFHDIHKTTVDDLPRIVTQLREAGCQRFVTLSEYLRGILDPEPPLLMSRRKTAPRDAYATNQAAHVNFIETPEKSLAERISETLLYSAHPEEMRVHEEKTDTSAALPADATQNAASSTPEQSL